MRLGTISLWTDEIEDFRSQLRLADELGVSLVGVGEVPTSSRGLYISLAIAASETKNALIGPMVTSPHLHHPLATVRAMSALQEISGGRAVLGFGAGNSIALGTGQRFASLNEMREYVLTMRSLFEGESVIWKGGKIKPLRHVHPVPIYCSAFGPKSMRQAGELGDGVILITGSIDHARASIDLVHEGARAAGRDPSQVEIWTFSVCSTGQTRAAALHDIAPILAAGIGMYTGAKGGMDGIPEDIKARLIEAQSRYDYNEHGLAGSANARLAEELGLLEFLAENKVIAGTPGEMRDHFAALNGLGISLVMCPVMGFVDADRSIRLLSEAAMFAERM